MAGKERREKGRRVGHGVDEGITDWRGIIKWPKRRLVSRQTAQ